MHSGNSTQAIFDCQLPIADLQEASNLLSSRGLLRQIGNRQLAIGNETLTELSGANMRLAGYARPIEISNRFPGEPPGSTGASQTSHETPGQACKC